MTDHRALEANPEVRALREDIRQTRAELGDTVQALAAKADVKARVSQTAADARERVKESASHTAAQVRDTAVHTAVQVKGSAAHLKDSASHLKDSAEVVLRRARQWAVGGPDGHRAETIGPAGAGHGIAVRRRGVSPAAVRQRLTTIGSPRQQPGPWVAGAVVCGATAVIMYVVIRRRRV